jgi:hypothetical protein
VASYARGMEQKEQPGSKEAPLSWGRASQDSIFRSFSPALGGQDWFSISDIRAIFRTFLEHPNSPSVSRSVLASWYFGPSPGPMQSAGWVR